MEPAYQNLHEIMKSDQDKDSNPGLLYQHQENLSSRKTSLNIYLILFLTQVDIILC